MALLRTLMRPLAFAAGMEASRHLKAFLDAHRNTRRMQDNLLRELLQAHRRTAFGRDHGFASIADYQEFTSAVPVRTYEQLRPYMQRVFHGEFDALLPPGQKVLMFAQTSGTTGKCKYIPVTRAFLEQMRRGFGIFGLRALRDHPEGWLRPILQISSPAHESTSPTGLPCGAISGLLAATQRKVVRWMYVVPQAVAALREPEARYYTMLRCGIEKDVAVITTANPSSTIKLIETGQRHAEQLVRDVADGTINAPGGLPKELNSALRFKRNPALAGRISEGIRQDGRLLPKHFWRPAFLTNWTGGTLKLYLPRLRELFGDVPIRDIGLLASEGRFSIPIEDHTPAGLAEITGNFLEFIPADQAEKDDPDVLRADELEVGKEYFIVVTNWAGLWRYNIDDRVRVTEFYHSTPVFEFLSRGLHTANITGEKITEYQVVEAMRIAAGKAGVRIEQFELQGRFAAVPYYELRLESTGGAEPERIAELMDQALCELNIEYRSKRSSARLGAVRAVVLPTGTLSAAEQAKIHSRGGRSEQYKHQYLLTDVIDQT